MTKTPQTEALESLQDHINAMPEKQRIKVMMWAEEIRDLLSEGGDEAFTALALVSCELGAVHAERERMEAASDDSPAAE